jgi:hypothetical protein
MKQMKQNVKIGHVIISILDVMEYGRVKMELMILIVRLQFVLYLNMVASFSMILLKSHVYPLLELMMVLLTALARPMNVLLVDIQSRVYFKNIIDVGMIQNVFFQ